MKKYKYLALFILGIVFTWSCSDDTLDEIDTDPNNPTDVPIDFILPNAQINMVNDFFGGSSSHALHVILVILLLFRLVQYPFGAKDIPYLWILK